ncbi:MAG: DUF2975 domain-containing protein [Chlorobi bacterium]|nr:DUF2975 domain-containing protein [Chlorobiota bacterium]
MNKNKKPLSIRIIYWSTEVVFWLFLMVLVLSVGINIAFFSEAFGDKMQLSAALPVEVNYTEKGTMDIFGEPQEIEFTDALGKIHFIDTNPDMAKVFGVALLIVVIISLYIFVNFRRFIGNVYRGYIFEPFNIQMLKNMAYGLVIFWIFDVIYKGVFYYLFVRNIEFKHLEITGNFSSDGILLVIALFLWMLSHIFMIGVKLQKEQELTV